MVVSSLHPVMHKYSISKKLIHLTVFNCSVWWLFNVQWQIVHACSGRYNTILKTVVYKRHIWCTSQKRLNILLFVKIMRKNNDPDKIHIPKNKITKLQEKFKTKKSLIKWRNQKLKNIKRMINSCHILDLVHTIHVV